MKQNKKVKIANCDRSKNDNINYGRAIALGFLGAALLLIPIAAGVPMMGIAVVIVPAAAMLI